MQKTPPSATPHRGLGSQPQRCDGYKRKIKRKYTSTLLSKKEGITEAIDFGLFVVIVFANFTLVVKLK